MNKNFQWEKRERIFLVTGATGHLGSFLIEGLFSIKHTPICRHNRTGKSDIRCLIRKTSETKFIERYHVQFAIGELCQIETLYPAMEGVDCLIHLAGMQFHKNVLDACVANGVKRLILIGSAHIYSKVDKPKARMLMEANETVAEYSHMNSNDSAQVITYLTATKSPVGLLLNFGERSLVYRRILPPKKVTQHHINRQWLFVPDWLNNKSV